jgi:hypothetical protein
MHSRTNRLPSRFPIGTRYIVEGRHGRRGSISARDTSNSPMAGAWNFRLIGLAGRVLGCSTGSDKIIF